MKDSEIKGLSKWGAISSPIMLVAREAGPSYEHPKKVYKLIAAYTHKM